MMPFSMFYLFQSLNLSKNGSAIGGLLASTLYLFNIFSMNQCFWYYIYLFNSFLPLIVAFLIKGLKTKKLKKHIKYSIIIACSITGMSTIATNVSYLASLIIISTVIFVAYFKIAYLKQQISFFILCLVFTILMNFYWFVSLHGYLNNLHITSFGTSRELVLNSMRWNSIWSAKLYEAIRLLGSWAFRVEMYFPYNGLYYGKSYLITCYSYIIPILVFSSLLIKKNKKEITLFSLIALIGLFLVKGANQPFGYIFLYFFDFFNWMYMFRSPYEKFTGIVVFAYSIMYGYIGIHVLFYIQNKFSDSRKKALSLLFIGTIILLTAITAFPTITKRISSPIFGMTLHIKMPHYWETMEGWFYKNDSNSRVMSLPRVGYTSLYKWGKTISWSATPYTAYMIPNPTIQLFDHAGGLSSSLFFKTINTLYLFLEKPKAFNNLLNILSVKYIIQQNDICYNHPAYRNNCKGYPGSPPYINGALMKNTRITYLKSFEKLDVYNINNDNAIIYAR